MGKHPAELVPFLCINGSIAFEQDSLTMPIIETTLLQIFLKYVHCQIQRQSLSDLSAS